MNPLLRIRERIGAVIGTSIFSLLCGITGVVLVVFVAAGQSRQARQIETAPVLDASSFAALAPGDFAVVSGTLTDNTPVTGEFVAFETQRWDVTYDSEDDEYDGDWQTVNEQWPALIIAVDGGTVRTVTATSVNFDGSPREVRDESTTGRMVDGVREDTVRTIGFYNGDLITVTGDVASTGDLIPDRVFAGDRVQLVDDIRQGARVARGIGIALLIGAPLLFVMGIIGAILGRVG
ncbi:MAG: hypothetical protein GYB64_10005 [Chloroflexi bacterium]|nr:hypothetical protein [Chloroflexota bacterium]